jgi:hypothetical protein
MKALPIFAGIAALLACGLAWEMLPVAGDGVATVSRPDPAPAADGANTKAGVDAAADPGQLMNIAGTLLARPLFSASRRLATATAAAPPDPVSVVQDAPPRLTGIIISPAASLAIFDGGSGRPKIVAEGGSIGRFKVETIAPDQVALVASDGTVVLRPKFARSAGASGVPMAQAAAAR